MREKKTKVGQSWGVCFVKVRIQYKKKGKESLRLKNVVMADQKLLQCQGAKKYTSLESLERQEGEEEEKGKDKEEQESEEKAETGVEEEQAKVAVKSVELKGGGGGGEEGRGGE